MRIAVATVCAVMLAVAGASAQSLPSLKELMEKWNRPTEPFKLIGNIHYVGTDGLASYLITTSQGHILIDTGLPEANPLIKASIEKLGFKVTDIKFLLNTHAHLDHAGGFADLKKETGAHLVAGEGDRPLLEGGYYPGRDDARFPPVKVDRAIKDGETIGIGDTVLTAHSTPGHSPGCTSWTLNVKDGEVMRSVMVFCSATVAYNRLVGNPTYPRIVDDYRKTFAWARGVKVDVFLAPHPEMYGMHEKRSAVAEGAPNPFVNPGEFNIYIEGLEEAFEASLAKQTAGAQAK
jgi:metallo-beta-lactamase class B